jgi:adenine-specific DNA-methyltransferase
MEYKLILGDTWKEVKKFPNEKFQLIITSPPYNIGKEYEVRKSLDDYLKQYKELLVELKRVLKPNGSICWQVGNYTESGEIFPLDIEFYPIFKELGFKLRNRIIWHFGHGLHAKKRLSGRYETILWFTKSEDYYFNLDPIRVKQKYPGKLHYKGEKKGLPSGNENGKNPSDFWDDSETIEKLKTDWESFIWEIPNVKANHKEKTNHPCQFPIELVKRCVLALSAEDDWVLDPFTGVGSTNAACILSNRNSIGIEQEKKYYVIAKDRIEIAKIGELKFRPLNKKIHSPRKSDKVAQDPWKK